MIVVPKYSCADDATGFWTARSACVYIRADTAPLRLLE